MRARICVCMRACVGVFVCMCLCSCLCPCVCVTFAKSLGKRTFCTSTIRSCSFQTHVPHIPCNVSVPALHPLPQECDHLVKLGAKHITPSDVVDSETGEIVRSKERTSRCVQAEVALVQCHASDTSDLIALQAGAWFCAST